MTSNLSDVIAFISPDSRHRFVKLYERRGRSSKDLAKWSVFLASPEVLDPTVSVPLRPSTKPNLHRELIRLGAPETCHVIAESEEFEGRFPLPVAIEAVYGHGYCAIIVCEPGRLGYYEGEPFGRRYILHVPET